MNPGFVVSVLACAVLGVGCDHHPPPKQTAVARDAGMPVPPVDAATVAIAPGDGGFQVTDACVAVGVKIAQMLIDATTDPQQRAVLEQERTRLVRRNAEHCTRQGWNAEVRACYLAANTRFDMEACAKKAQSPS